MVVEISVKRSLNLDLVKLEVERLADLLKVPAIYKRLIFICCEKTYNQIQNQKYQREKNLVALFCYLLLKRDCISFDIVKFKKETSIPESDLLKTIRLLKRSIKNFIKFSHSQSASLNN